MKYNYTRYIKMDYYFLNLPEILATIDNYKGVGFSAVVFIAHRLLYRTHAIGKLKNLGNLHIKIGIQNRTLIKMIKEIPVFKVDEENGLFWIPRQRKKLGLSADPTEEEIKEVLEKGNLFFDGVGKHSVKKRCSKDKTESISNHSSKPASQLTDNEEKQGNIKDIDISNKNKEITSNKAIAKQVSDCASDDADEKEFKEILSSRSWCKSVTKRMGIDLTNEKVLDCFAEWMHAYCITNEKKVRGRSELRKYAANLLRKDTKTRAEIEKYLDEHISQAASPGIICTQEKSSEYEQVYNGIRYSAAGNRLPDWAPPQPSLDVSFSYIQGRWIINKEFNWEKEKIVLEDKEINVPGYFKEIGGAA